MDKAIEQLGAVCKASGDALRLQILLALRQDAFGVLELTHIFGVRQPAMSHHLKVLAKAGLVVPRKEGTFVFYRRNINDGSPIAILREQIFKALDTTQLPVEAQRKMTGIRAERATSSQAFFEHNADKFRQHQDLIASYSVYGDAVLELLDQERHRGASSVLEIGPGEGELLGELVERFDRVIAVDNAPAMLERSRRRVAASGSDKQVRNKVEFHLGEANAQTLKGTQVDVATLNMVLHHIASPADLFEDIYKLLAPGGTLIITELCQHDQDWVRETCGDQWLGFCPEELGAWAGACGFSAGECIYMAQRNGFRIQLHSLRKPAGKPAASDP